MVQTWKIDKPQQRQFAIAALVLQMLMLAAAIALNVWREAGSWIVIVVIGASLIPTMIAWKQTRMRTTADDSGLAIYDGARTRNIPWAQVDAIGKHESRDDIVAMRHTDGSDVVLPGVHGRDVSDLRRIVRDHR